MGISKRFIPFLIPYIGPPVVTLYPFLGERSPTKVNYRKNKSSPLLEDLALLTPHYKPSILWFPFFGNPNWFIPFLIPYLPYLWHQTVRLNPTAQEAEHLGHLRQRCLRRSVLLGPGHSGPGGPAVFVGEPNRGFPLQVAGSSCFRLLKTMVYFSFVLKGIHTTPTPLGALGHGFDST